MKHLVVLAVLLAFGLAACGSENEPAPERPTATPTSAAPTTAAAQTVTDMTGREVAVPETIERVVALSPASVELLFAIGVTPVGRVEDATAPPEAAEVPAVGSSLAPDFEAVAALEPDLVLADNAFQAGRGADFDRFPVPVFVITASTYDKIGATLDALGALLGRETEAAALHDELEQTVTDLLASAGDAAPTVAIISGSGRELLGLTEESYVGSLVDALGAANVVEPGGQTATLPGFAPVELEALAALAPDVVLIIPAGDEQPVAEQIAASPTWQGTAAVANGRVHEIDRDLFLRAPGPRAIEALEALFALLYPDAAP